MLLADLNCPFLSSQWGDVCPGMTFQDSGHASWLRQGGIQLNSRYQTVAPISNCLYIVYIDGLQLAGNMSYSSTATTCLKHVEHGKSILENIGKKWKMAA